MSEPILNQHKPGRKSRAHLARARELINLAVSDEQWVQCFQVMLALVLTSQDSRARVMALRLLCEYAFGKPPRVVESPDPDAESESKPDEPYDKDLWGPCPPEIVGADRVPYLIKVNTQNRPPDDDDALDELDEISDSVEPTDPVESAASTASADSVPSAQSTASAAPPDTTSQASQSSLPDSPPTDAPPAAPAPVEQRRIQKGSIRYWQLKHQKNRKYRYPATKENPMPCTDD